MFILVISLLTHGCPVQAVVAAFGLDGRTVREWWDKSGQHCRDVHEQVIGQSDDKATLPANEAIAPDDVAASFYHNLGIDHTKEYRSTSGRPITIVRNGTVIQQLFA